MRRKSLKKKLKRIGAKVVIGGLEGGATFIDCFRLPSKRLHKGQIWLVRYASKTANEYRKMIGRKPKRYVRIKKVRKGKVHLEEL